MKSRTYWINRAARLESSLQRDAMLAAERVTEAYERAIDEINEEIERTFKAYVGTGIPEEKARELLSKAEHDKLYRDLLKLHDETEDAAVKRDIEARINAQAYGARISRLEGVKERIYIEMRKAGNYAQKEQRLLYMNTLQRSYYTTIYNAAEGLNCGIDFTVLPRREIDRALNAKWKGGSYSKRIWKHNKGFIEAVRDAVITGMAAGQGIPQMEKRLTKWVKGNAPGGVQAATERLVRTETAHFMNRGQLEAYEEIGIEKYRFVAALSERTCSICAMLDGKQFDISKAREGENYPPIHPNCRCTTIMADANPKTRIARDPETGKNYKVDGNMTFEEWKEGLTEEQKQAMETHVKQMKNRSSDMKQYEKYKRVLGKKNLPKTFDEWQDLKYNGDKEKYNLIKLDYKRQNKVQMWKSYTSQIKKGLLKDDALNDAKAWLADNPVTLLPNAKKATADDRKFTEYLFGGRHEEGLAKGKAFTSRLGYDMDNYAELKAEILSKTDRYNAKYKGENRYGKLYEQKMVLYEAKKDEKKNLPANVIVGWCSNNEKTWLTSAYIKEVN